MPSAQLLTSDDLDELGSFAFRAEKPLEVVAELVEAVERGLLADEADTGYALILAAEITDREGDLHCAAELADRSVAASDARGEHGFDFPRAFRAELWMRLGRTDEAMAELRALRPLLTRRAEAASYLTSTLERCGLAEIAEQWLTAALVTALEHRQDLTSHRPEPAYAHAAEVAFGLAQQRHRLRRDLDLPHDEHDQLADQLWEAMHDQLDEDEQPGKGVILFWPQPEFEELLQRWPELAETYGSTWDEHRETVERNLTQGWEAGHSQAALLTGAADELTTHVRLEGAEPTNPRVRAEYAYYLQRELPPTTWPPRRNDSCWCGSGSSTRNAACRGPAAQLRANNLTQAGEGGWQRLMPQPPDVNPESGQDCRADPAGVALLGAVAARGIELVAAHAGGLWRDQPDLWDARRLAPPGAAR